MLRLITRKLLVCLSMALVLPCITHAANPLAFNYKNTTNASLFARPTGMIVTGRCNRYDTQFMNARGAGAEVLAYLNTVERPDSPICAMDEEFYMGNSASVPLWGRDANGNWRVNFDNHTLVDLRAGSAWSDFVVSYVEQIIREDRVDGVFLDAIGSRLWGDLANWDSWPVAERRAWTEGSVAAESADPEMPAFIARPSHAPVYHGFPLLENAECEGFTFGAITEPSGAEPAAWGDAFVVAPNGSRAGIVWQIGRGEPSVVCEPSEGRWGVYSFYFEGPIRAEADLVSHLRSVVPALNTYYKAAESTCPESTRAAYEDAALC